MGVKVKTRYIVDKFITLWLEVKFDPSNMMFRGIGMGYFFPQRNFDFKEIACFDYVLAFNDGDVFFVLPISVLNFIS